MPKARLAVAKIDDLRESGLIHLPLSHIHPAMASDELEAEGQQSPNRAVSWVAVVRIWPFPGAGSVASVVMTRLDAIDEIDPFIVKYPLPCTGSSICAAKST